MNIMILFFINCATTTTHLSSAHVLDPGHVESTVAGALYTNTVVTNHSIKTAAAIYEGMLEDPPEVTTEMARDMFDTGLAWTLFFPGQSSEFIGRVGLTNALLEGVDLGFRSNGSQSKIDIKTQLFASKNQRWAVAFASGFGWNQTLISTKVSQYTRSTFPEKIWI